jgi:hypothetical protein
MNGANASAVHFKLLDCGRGVAEKETIDAVAVSFWSRPRRPRQQVNRPTMAGVPGHMPIHCKGNHPRLAGSLSEIRHIVAGRVIAQSLNQSQASDSALNKPGLFPKQRAECWEQRQSVLISN